MKLTYYCILFISIIFFKPSFSMAQQKLTGKIEHIAQTDARKINVAPSFIITEYGRLGNGIANGTVALVNSRYPEKGWGYNTACDELVYVISGQGYIETPDEKIELTQGSVAFIPKGQKIAWFGKDLKVFIPCIPAWTYEQHILEDAQ